MKIKEWVSYKYVDDYKENEWGGLGGWFIKGMRWKDYLETWDSNVHPYIEAFRKNILENNIKRGADWHQNKSADGVPLFDDNTITTFSYRAWGDILAAIWSEEEMTDYGYMDFYMDATIKKQ